MLGIVGIICFVLAGAYIVKLAIDSGWLTPARQIGAAITLGITLIAAGFRLREMDRGYASLLPGAGVAILYLSVIAAHLVHSLISFSASIAGISLVSITCIWLYTRLRHDIYPITAAISSYLSPLLLSAFTGEEFSIYYYVVCSIAFAGIAVWLESRILAIIATYLSVGMTALIGLGLENDSSAAIALPFHFLIFATATYYHTVLSGKPLKTEEAWAFFPALMIFYAAEYSFIHRMNPQLAPWISLGFAAFLIGLYLAAQNLFRKTALRSKDMILGFAAIVVFHSLYLEILTEHIRPWLFIIIILAVTFTGLNQARTITSHWIPALFAGVILVIEYIRIAFFLLDDTTNVQLLLGFGSVTVLYMFYLMRIDPARDRGDAGFVILGAAHGMAILGLYRLFSEGGSLAVSGGWLGYAAIIIGLGFHRKDPVIAKSALMVLSLAAAKALIYDTSSASPGVRILCLLLTGAVLYGCGLILKRIQSWKVGSV